MHVTTISVSGVCCSNQRPHAMSVHTWLDNWSLRLRACQHLLRRRQPTPCEETWPSSQRFIWAQAVSRVATQVRVSGSRPGFSVPVQTNYKTVCAANRDRGLHAPVEARVPAGQASYHSIRTPSSEPHPAHCCCQDASLQSNCTATVDRQRSPMRVISPPVFGAHVPSASYSDFGVKAPPTCRSACCQHCTDACLADTSVKVLKSWDKLPVQGSQPSLTR